MRCGGKGADWTEKDRELPPNKINEDSRVSPTRVKIRGIEWHEWDDIYKTRMANANQHTPLCASERLEQKAHGANDDQWRKRGGVTLIKRASHAIHNVRHRLTVVKKKRVREKKPQRCSHGNGKIKNQGRHK